MTDSTPATAATATRCWECSQKNGHALTGGVHQPYHCKPDLCPNRERHGDQVYGERLTRRYSTPSRDGVYSIVQIDGVDASKTHTQERCICGLLLIWNPK